MDNKNIERARRLLAQMINRDCSMRISQNGRVALVDIRGHRTIKCDMAIVENWLSSGVIALNGHQISITDAGRASIARHTATAQPFRAQHDAVTTKQHPDEAEECTVQITDESPLARLSKIKTADGDMYLSTVEMEAGERLRRDFERAMMQPRVTASLDPTRVAGRKNKARNTAADLTDTAIGARQRIANALDTLEPELAGVAIDICCFLKGLETVEVERCWPRRSAKLMLKTALGGLGRHYFPTAKPKHSSVATMHWGAEDYRPSMR